MRSLAIPVLLLCVAVSITTFLASPETAASQQDDQATATWEHLALTQDDPGLGGDLARQINRLGDEGWELVCVVPVTKDGSTVKTRYYFKRRKK